MEQTMKKLAQAIRRHTRRVMASALAACLVLAMLPMEARAEDTPAAPTVETFGGIKYIFANGAALIIAGDSTTTPTKTTVYVDADGDGVLDSGEQSLAALGITNAPADDADLSAYPIYGGSKSAGHTGNTKITMTGGKVHSIFGGGYKGDVTGNTEVTVGEGAVVYNNVYGGGYMGNVSGNTVVTVSGTARRVYGGGESSGAKTTAVGTAGANNTVKVTVSGTASSVYGGGTNHNQINGDTEVTVSGTVSGSVYGGGDFYSPVTGGTAVTISGTVKGSVYGGVDDGSANQNTAVTITDGAVTGNVYGGGNEGSVTQDTNVTITGSTVGGGVYGGGFTDSGTADVGGTATIRVTGNSQVASINGGGAIRYFGSAAVANAAITVADSTVTGSIYGGGANGATVTGTRTVTVGGSAKIGATDGENSYGVTINGGSGGTEVTNGVDSFKIDPSLTDNASVDVVLPAGYATGTIATGAVQADLAKIHLTGNGATGKTAAFENNTIVVKLSTTPPTGDAPTITTTSLPDGTIGTAYSQALAATSGTAITWSVASGSLPAGLSLNGSTGVISGTPTAAGTSSFTVKAENSAGSATKALSITISKPHYSISGSVMDSYAANLSGTVQLVQWGRVLQTVALGSTPCAFTFSGVAPGIYTLVATNTKGGTGSTCMTDTQQVTVADRDVTDVAMGWDHRFYVSSEVEVTGGTPPVSVGGLEQVAALIPNTQGSTAYTVKLTAEAVDAPADKAEIDAHAAGKAMDLYLDLSLLLLKDDSVIENLADAKGKVLGITVPYDFTDKQDVTVYRKHGSEAAQALMQNDSGDDGTFSLDRENGCIHIYASKFSTYAVGYIPVVTPPEPNPSHSSSGSGASSSTITATAGTGGSISPSGKVRVSRNSSKSFTIQPADGYVVDDVLVDGKSVGAVERYTFEKVTKAHTIAASFREETGKAAWNPFTDVREGDWFYDSVKYAYGHSLMLGTSPSAFSPEASTERGMIVTVLWRMEGQPEAAGIHAFTDVGSGAYYADAVAWADGNGIVLGYGDGKFGPEDTITREQLAAILWRYAQYKGKDVGAGGTLERFTDAAAVSGYAQEAMRWATGQGILSGKGDGILDPMGQATRAETAAMLMRYLQGGS
ncbi:S-layer homology domain-containing protein [Intestinibacillus massiliensis]|uniref:S-layer homology domain-containing protein n=1 Tax=Intestinibacillus massiliensis TaxID=1871029 RepID=UPI000B354FFC|nr:S-layer homology domain-containing protein [Intestinibacillus massiliensis]